MNPSTAHHDSRWPHRVAVMVVCAAFPLIWVGGLVTSTGAGMAVPDWPNTYGYNLLLYPWRTWLLGPWDIFVEHGHRLFGALVGVLCIVLCIVLWRCERRKWVRRYGLLLLAAVIAQGVLGGMRVRLNEELLAQIHGCTGPLFFAMCAAMAVVTSRLWREAESRQPSAAAGRLHTLAILTTALAYVQLVLGSQIRHAGVDLAPRAFMAAVVFHLAMAAVVTLHVAWLGLRIARRHRDEPALGRPAAVLALLVVVQLALGAGTWVTKYGWPAFVGNHPWTTGYVIHAGGFWQTGLSSAHVAAGSLILGLCLTITLRSVRLLRGGARQVSFQPLTMGLAG